MTALKVLKGKPRSLRAKAKVSKKKFKYNRPDWATPAYQNFVRLVKERDRVKCQMPDCNKHTYNIEVHHILKWGSSVEMRYNPINGICLCQKCHKKVTGKEEIYAPLFFQIVQNNIRNHG